MARAPIYLVDYSVFNPTDDLRVDWEWHRKHSLNTWTKYGATMDKIEFCDKIYKASGIADRAALPIWLQPHPGSEPRTDTKHAGYEARMVQGQCVAEVLQKTGIEPNQIDILVTNCSIYCPVPSMTSMLINMFGMREDVHAYHLGGMGCSMGVVGLNLVKDMLAANPNKIALFVSNEVVTAGFYLGDRKEALITNSLFRMGGSAAILTNRPSWRLRAKYSLMYVNRVHTGRFPRAFSALNYEPDEKGVNGMVITKDLPSEAALALNKAIGKVAPLIMPWGQYADAALHFARDFAAAATGGQRLPKYQPDFTKCADKFLMHAGGYAILQAVKKGLRLPADKMMPSFVSLRDYGNTSSSSTWYTWAYIEACEGVKCGDRIMQIGVGGGMKAGVAVWRALRSFRDPHPAWAHLEGRPQQECDLPRPITVAYKSVYNQKAAVEAQARLAEAKIGNKEATESGAAGNKASTEKLHISFDPAEEPRHLNVRSWKDMSRTDLTEWYRCPPGQPIQQPSAEGPSVIGGAAAPVAPEAAPAAEPIAAGEAATAPAWEQIREAAVEAADTEGEAALVPVAAVEEAAEEQQASEAEAAAAAIAEAAAEMAVQMGAEEMAKAHSMQMGAEGMSKANSMTVTGNRVEVLAFADESSLI